MDRDLFCGISRRARRFGWDRYVNFYAANKIQLSPKKPIYLCNCLGDFLAHYVSGTDNYGLCNYHPPQDIRNLWKKNVWGYILTIFLAFAAGVTFMALSVSQILLSFSYQQGNLVEVVQMVVFAVIASGFSLAAFKHIED